MAKILIFESPNENSAHKFLESSHEVLSFTETKNFVPRIRKLDPHIVLIDLGFQSEAAFEICSLVKADPKLSSIPVIAVIPANSSPQVFQTLFEKGADDWLLKPFNELELKIKCESKLRLVRHILDTKDILDWGDIRFDVVKRMVMIYDQGQNVSIRLSPSEFQLLLLLCKNQGRILGRDEIYKELCKKNPKSSDTRVIDAQISSIRRKSNYFQQNIESIHGVGYRMS